MYMAILNNISSCALYRDCSYCVHYIDFVHIVCVQSMSKNDIIQVSLFYVPSDKL